MIRDRLPSSRFLVRFSLAALALLLLTEVAGSAVISASDAPALRWHDHSAELKVQQMDELSAAGGATTVILGTSMAQQALLPAALAGDGVAYNAALNGGIPELSEQWYFDVVAPRLQPDTVIWALGPLDVSAVYGASTLDAFETALQTKDGLLASSERATARFSPLVRNRTVLRDPSALLGRQATARRNARAAVLEVTGPSGERLDFTPSVNPARAAEVRGRLTPFTLDRNDLAALARSVDRLQSDNITVVFVELPTPARFDALYPNGPDTAAVVSETLIALARELNVPLIEVSGTYADEDFVDFTHLNAEAAARFSQEVSAALGG